MQGGTVCNTKDGAKDSFYVFHLDDQDDQEDVEEDEGETGGIAGKLQKKVRDHQSEQGVEAGMLPDFDWSDEDQDEMSDAIRDALEATDAWQRYLDEGPETQGGWAGGSDKYGVTGTFAEGERGVRVCSDGTFNCYYYR